MGSIFTQVDDRWAVLGSVGWQQWSRFGKAQVSIDSSNPTSLTADLNYKDTWHVAGGAQYRLSDPWLLNFGVAYDSAFQSNTVPLTTPANAAWRFGIGAQQQTTQSFNWGVAAEYAYGGTSTSTSKAHPSSSVGAAALSASSRVSAAFSSPPTSAGSCSGDQLAIADRQGDDHEARFAGC